MALSQTTGLKSKIEGPAKSLRRLRVLHVGKFYPPHPGGMETHLQSLCGELKGMVNLEVAVANDAWRSMEEIVDGVKISRLGTAFNFFSAPICPGLLRKIKKSDADIVHLHLPHPAAVLTYLASGHKGCLVLTYHSDIVRQKIMGRAFEPIMHRALKRADAVIVTSQSYLDSSPILPHYREKCRVIPFGIRTEDFQTPDPLEIARIRRQFGPCLILGVGRLVYYKGFEYLIRAMNKINASLLLIGDGPLRDRLLKEARIRGVQGKVHFLEGVEDVIPYYHAAEVFVLPSIARSEAFGIVQLEAMACGKPVVNTLLDSGVPVVSLDGVTGLTVAPADPEVLAHAVNLLLENHELRARYGEAAKRRVWAEFRLELMTRRTLNLYNSLSIPSKAITAADPADQ